MKSSMTAEAIVRQYGKNIREKRDGWLVSCLYSDHSDSTPSMSIRTDGVFMCWGCQKHGNLATLLHDIVGYSWKRARALGKIADDCKPAPELLSPDWATHHGPTNIRISKGLLGLYEVDWRDGYLKYKAAVAEGETDDFPAWAFPFLRGFTPKTLNFFDAGYDSHYQRVTIPIHNLYGQLIGFVGRTCIGAEQKYMVYPPLLPSNDVYGLHRVVHHHGLVLLVEGPWDVWFLYQIDPTIRAVAIMTSHVQKAQIDKLVTAHKHYVILFDADKAGRKGATSLARALVDRGCKIDIATSTKENIKDLTARELQKILGERKPFPSFELATLSRKGLRRWLG